MRPPRPTRNQRGALIIWLALFLLVLIGFVSIGIDVAKLAATQGQLQTAADAAALAGAGAIDAGTGKIIHDQAIARAQATGAANKAYELVPTSVGIDAADISFPTDTTIKVIARRSGATAMITHFAAAFLGSTFHSLDINASAVAMVLKGGSCCGQIPVAAIPPPGAGGFIPGCGHTYDLRGDQPGTPSGNYGALDFPACGLGVCADMPVTGASTFRCLLANGYCCCIPVGTELQTEPGSMSGPVRQGLQDRWDADTDTRPNICYEQYTGNGQRVVQVPITTPITDPGRQTVTLLAWANFFLINRPMNGPSQPITVEFVDKVNPGPAGGAGNGTQFVVRLIQ
ncbi:MAG TPA: pilus assembly protein TadG-related protein [Candidatus Udaeobacter sp.]|jgi:hypothetical protein|nr:pilus assembly protein TadG-related protein [Candidatus Udaeobacter sp.]